MVKIVRNPNDSRYIFLVGADATDRKHLAELEKYMNKIPKYMLLPTCKIPPSPEVFLEKFRGSDGNWIYYCSAGLWKEVIDYFDENNIYINKNSLNRDFKYTQFNLTKDEFKSLVASWNLNIEPRDYQLDAAWLILKYRLSLSELATRAGKTLIFMIVARAAKEVLGVHNILMIVPSIHLVKQGVKDLQEYKEYFNAEQIWADGEEVEMADLTIGTFQSLVRKADPRYKNYNPTFFDKYDFVCVDEAHKSPCKSIKKILSLEAFKNMKLRFGFTGTLPKPGTIESFACQAMLGPKIQEISARELIDEGYLADPVITQYRLVYNQSDLTDIIIKCGEYLLSSYKKVGGKQVLLPEDRRQFTMVHEKVLPVALQQARELLEPEEYAQHIISMCKASSKTLNLEQLMAMFSVPRIDLIKQLIGRSNKNIIVFAHNVEYIKYLEQILSVSFPDRNIYRITGATNLKKRQQVLDKMLESDNNILIGSFSVIGTGLTVRNVDYGIFAQSFKADTITRQSLGRLMLRTEEKSEFYLYDIIDSFPTKKIHSQGLEKVKIYKTNKFQNKVIKKSVKFQEIF